MTTISIVIPTVPGNELLLKRALTSLVKHKDPNVDYELIVVANNWEGFSIPVNLGIKRALGNFVLIMNDDVIILDRGWEQTMLKSISEPNVGIVGHYESAQHNRYSALWFTLIKKEVFQEVGLLDETMNLYSQDIDFGYKSLKAGFETRFVDIPVRHFTSSTTGRIPFEDNEILKNEAKELFKNKWGINHDDA